MKGNTKQEKSMVKEEATRIVVSEQDYSKILDSSQNPPEPSARMKAAFKSAVKRHHRGEE